MLQVFILRKNYWSKNFLNRHEKKHTGDNPYECTTCGDVCDSADALRSHEKVHACDILTLRCTLCLMNFKTRRDWLVHQNSEHGDIRLQHQCDKCGAKFPNHSHLWRHYQLHLKRHTYTYCGKRI